MSPPSLALPQIAFRRPLVNLGTAVAALDLSSYAVLSLIDEGKLRWAWNIACGNSGQREVRILTHSLVEFQRGQPAPCVSEAEDFNRVIKLVFPAVSQTRSGIAAVRAATIARRLSTTTQHLFNLVEGRSLRWVKGTVCRPGPNGSPAIEFATVVAFLRKRRIA